MFTNDNIDCIKENKYFLSILIIIINLGARFIVEELTPEQRKIVNSTVVRKIVLFSLLFMATKDFMISLTLTIITFLIINEFSIFENKKINNIKNEKNEKMKKINNEISGVLNRYL
jgi:hypothetical protein